MTRMAIHIRDVETEALVRELARRHKIGLAEAAKKAVGIELQRQQESVPLKVRIAALRAEVLKRPDTGLPVDKVFDDLSNVE